LFNLLFKKPLSCVKHILVILFASISSEYTSFLSKVQEKVDGLEKRMESKLDGLGKLAALDNVGAALGFDFIAQQFFEPSTACSALLQDIAH